jgi:hypothetical protein
MLDSAMSSQDDPVQVYKELSDWYERRGEPPMRDRFLVLAADAALRAGQVEEADKLRLRLLKLNPHHLLKPYTSFTQAAQAPDIQTYLRDLRLNYPPEVALVLLNSLRSATNLTREVPLLQPREDDESTVALGEAAEPLRVYADAPDHDAPETQALPQELLQPARRLAPNPPRAPAAAQPPRAPAVAQPLPRPLPAPPLKKKAVPMTRTEPRPATARAYRPAPEPKTSSGGWFAMILFILVFLTGLVLAGYLVARPFLSRAG